MSQSLATFSLAKINNRLSLTNLRITNICFEARTTSRWLFKSFSSLSRPPLPLFEPHSPYKHFKNFDTVPVKSSLSKRLLGLRLPSLKDQRRHLSSVSIRKFPIKKMRSYIEFVTTPSADTPGTLLFLHFDDQRYAVGQLSEGSTRACSQRKISFRKVSDILLTGRSKWGNMGGLFGFTLSLADMQKAAAESIASNFDRKPANQTNEHKKRPSPESSVKLTIHGPPNLNHAIATSRRFIFRTGLPIEAKEYTSQSTSRDLESIVEPTVQDKNIRVWAMSIAPVRKVSKTDQKLDGNKDIEFFESNVTQWDTPMSAERNDDIPKEIVSQMFNSDWKYDRLVSIPLNQVPAQAAVFVKDPMTNKTVPYTGPRDAEKQVLPNINVLIRTPWPGAQTSALPKTQPAPEALSYIIRNHAQRGRFQPSKAMELKVPKGPLFRELTSGRSVKNTDGIEITPDMVLEPGTAGGGVAVIDLPEADYVNPLITRPEWRVPEIMEGVGAMIWILGPNVASDFTLQQFQQEFSHLEHIIASPETCPDELSLETPATAALRHNYVDAQAFPKLKTHLSSGNSGTLNKSKIKSISARRGLRFVLEPRLELESVNVVPAYSVPETEEMLEKEYLGIVDKNELLALGEPIQSDHDWLTQIPSPDAEIYTLGTGSAHPSTHRNVSSTLVRVPGCGSYLLDCGEGTLGTLKRLFSESELSEVLRDLKMIWVSHMHADHHLGTTSVIKEWYRVVHQEKWAGSQESKPQLAIVSRSPMLHWLKEFSMVEDIGFSHLLLLESEPGGNVYRLSPSKTILRKASTVQSRDEEKADTLKYLDQLELKALETVFVVHCSGAQAISVTFKSGFKVSYSGDCRPSAGFAAIGHGSHVLLHEATFEDDMRGEAIAKKHSTAGEALTVACQMDARACILTHFSQRYATTASIDSSVVQLASKPLLSEAEILNQEDPLSQDLIPESEVTDNIVRTESGINYETGSKSKRQLEAEYIELVDSGKLNSVLAAKGIKVVSAYDYMRVRIRDIPRLERKQPLLRKIYEEIAKEPIQSDPVPPDTNDEPQNPKKKKKPNKEKKQVVA